MAAISKSPTQNNKWKTLQKLILSYFHNVLNLMGQISDNDMLRLAFAETAKLVPYVTSNRKTVKVYLKVRQLLSESLPTLTLYRRV